MSNVDDAFAAITRRAREAAGEAVPAPRTERSEHDSASPLAALHGTYTTGVPCVNGCPDDAAAYVALGSGEPEALCPRCVARARFAAPLRGTRPLIVPIERQDDQ